MNTTVKDATITAGGEQVQTDVIRCDLREIERQTIAFLYALWQLQGTTNKKIVTVRER